MIFNIIIIASCVLVLGHSFPIRRFHLTSRNNVKDFYPIARYTGRENHEYEVKSKENGLDKSTGETMTAEILNKLSGPELPSDYEEDTKSELSERKKGKVKLRRNRESTRKHYDRRSIDKIGEQTEYLQKQISAGMATLDKYKGKSKGDSLKSCSGVDDTVKTKDRKFKTRRFGHRVGWGTDVLNADTQVERSNSHVPVNSLEIVCPELTYNEKYADTQLKEEKNAAKKKRTWRRLSIHHLHRKQKHNDERSVNKIGELIENLKKQISAAMADLDKDKGKNKDDSLKSCSGVDDTVKTKVREFKTRRFGHRVEWGPDVLNADTQVEPSTSKVPVNSHEIVGPEITYNENKAEPQLKEEINSAKKKRTLCRLSKNQLHRKENHEERNVDKIGEKIEDLKKQISAGMADLDKDKDKNKFDSLNIFPRVDCINKSKEHEVRTSRFGQDTKLKTDVLNTESDNLEGRDNLVSEVVMNKKYDDNFNKKLNLTSCICALFILCFVILCLVILCSDIYDWSFVVGHL